MLEHLVTVILFPNDVQENTLLAFMLFPVDGCVGSRATNERMGYEGRGMYLEVYQEQPYRF